MKSLKNLGKTLSSKEQKNIHGGLGRNSFFESECYPRLDRCLLALQSAIDFGVNPNSTCVSCTTEWGTPGYKVEAFL